VSNLQALAARWNEAGRAHHSKYSEQLTRYYRDRVDIDLTGRDPRSRELGEEVLREVIAFNAAGEWQRARETFDPAYEPLFGWIEQTQRALPFVTVLGPDEVLVRRGSAWEDDAITLHLRGGDATPIDDVLGFARSRNRDYLVLARASGLEIRDARAGIAGLGGPPIAAIPWPSTDVFRPRGLAPGEPWTRVDGPFLVESVEMSDDGTRVVVSCYQQGILLASRRPGDAAWTLLWPDAALAGDEEVHAGDMTHVAISRDGARVAYGCQFAGHFLAEIGAGAEVRPYAVVGHASEYPHHACFSRDGEHTALNSCHFYEGATVAFDWRGHRGAKLAPWKIHPEAPLIDEGLRVYAACWLDESVARSIAGPDVGGLFALAGSGVVRFVTPEGVVHGAQGFGSSAGSIDFCPESRRLAIASDSGFVHLYDPYEAELPGRIDGYRARRELARWVLWEHLPNGPIRW
jgi:hypothetical protein